MTEFVELVKRLPAAEQERLADACDVVAMVLESWPNFRPDNAQLRRYLEDIARLDPREAAAAVEALKRSRSRDFAPTAGAVAYEVARLQVDAPEWGDVKRQLVRRRLDLERTRSRSREWVCPDDHCDGSGFVVDGRETVDCSCRPAMIAAKRLEDGLHPLVREFVSDGYATWGEVEDVAGGGATTLEAQMRSKWEAFARGAIESRALAAIDGPNTLRRLERARDEDAPRRGPSRGQLGKPDFLAALPG